MVLKIRLVFCGLSFYFRTIQHLVQKGKRHHRLVFGAVWLWFWRVFKKSKIFRQQNRVFKRRIISRIIRLRLTGKFEDFELRGFWLGVYLWTFQSFPVNFVIL